MLGLVCSKPGGCPYTDDALSSRKIAPGFVFKSRSLPKGSLWHSRLTVTEESASLMFNMIWKLHSSDRKPFKRSQLEEKAQVCALACSSTCLNIFAFAFCCAGSLSHRKVSCLLQSHVYSGALVHEVSAQVPNTLDELQSRSSWVKVFPILKYAQHPYLGVTFRRMTNCAYKVFGSAGQRG